VAVDAAGNREPAPAAPDALTVVALENRPPVFVAQPDVILWEGETLSTTVSATDPDGDAVTYQLEAGAPAGAVLHPTTGLLTWVTAEPHGPSTNWFVILARDSGTPSLTATQTFAVIVLESNTPPVMAPLTNATISEGTLLSFTVTATDGDLPAQSLRFSLGPGAPAGATIDPTNGLFRWRPTEFQGGTNYVISVIVTDSGVPPLSATQSFVVTVIDTRADFLLHLGQTAILTNASGELPLTLQSGTPLTRVELTLSLNSTRLTNLRLTGLGSGVGLANILRMDDTTYRLEFEPVSGQTLAGNLLLARLSFDTVTDPRSDVVWLRGTELIGRRANVPAAQGRAGVGRVFIVGAEPILDLQPQGSQMALTLYALPGQLYTIEQSTRLAPAEWLPIQVVTPVHLQTDLGTTPATPPVRFFRARTGEPLPLLSIRRESNQVILEWLAPCTGCVLQQSPSLGPGAVWTPSPVQPELTGDRYRVVFPIGPQPLFLRLVKP